MKTRRDYVSGRSLGSSPRAPLLNTPSASFDIWRRLHICQNREVLEISDTSHPDGANQAPSPRFNPSTGACLLVIVSLQASRMVEHRVDLPIREA